jgi:hypothetical protein
MQFSIDIVQTGIKLWGAGGRRIVIKQFSPTVRFSGSPQLVP